MFRVERRDRAVGHLVRVVDELGEKSVLESVDKLDRSAALLVDELCKHPCCRRTLRVVHLSCAAHVAQRGSIMQWKL